MLNGAFSPDMIKYERKKLEKKSVAELKKIVTQYNRPIYSGERAKLVDQIIDILQEQHIEVEKNQPTFFQKYHIKTILITISISFTLYLLYVAIFGIFKVKINRKVNKYCNTGEFRSRCIRCPSFAQCKDGIAKCEEDRDLVNGHCLIKDEDTMNVSVLLDIALNSLHRKAGEFKCGHSDVDYLDSDEIDILLFKSKLVPIDSYDRVLKKTLKQLKSEIEIVSKVKESLVYYTSLAPKESALCSFKNFMKTQVGTFVLFVLGICLILFAFRLGNKQKLDKNKARNQAILLITKMHGYYAEIDQITLQERFEDDVNFKDAYWPLIFYEIERSPLVTSRKNKGITYYRFIYK